MKLSIFYDHVLQAAEQSGKSVGAILASAYRAGILAVDINNGILAKEPELPTFLARAGMHINASFEFYNWGGDEYQNDTRFRVQIDNAVTHGYSIVLVVPGFLEDGEAKALNALLDEIGIPAVGAALDPRLDAFMKNSESIQKMTEMLRRAVAYGQEKGVTVTLEDFDNYRAPYARVLGLLWFMQNVQGLRFTLDTGNFVYSDERMEDGYALLKDYIVHVHTKDRGEEASCVGFRNKKGMAPAATGEGYLPILPCVRQLLEGGYNGTFAIEHYGHPDQATAMVTSAQNLKSC